MWCGLDEAARGGTGTRIGAVLVGLFERSKTLAAALSSKERDERARGTGLGVVQRDEVD